MLPRTTSLEEWKRVGSQSSLPKKKKGEIYPEHAPGSLSEWLQENFFSQTVERKKI